MKQLFNKLTVSLSKTFLNPNSIFIFYQPSGSLGCSQKYISQFFIKSTFNTFVSLKLPILVQKFESFKTFESFYTLNFKNFSTLNGLKVYSWVLIYYIRLTTLFFFFTVLQNLKTNLLQIIAFTQLISRN
jgi:hypothetical protein